MVIQPGNTGSPNSDGPNPPSKPTGQPNQHSQRNLYEKLLAGLLNWVWGQGKADVQRQIQQATPDTLATIIGHIVYALVQQGAEQAHQTKNDAGMNMDMLLGIATELIESLEKMAAAMNMQFDAHAVSLQALTQALNDYAESLPDGSAAQKEAQDALKQLSPSDMHQAAGTLSAIGQRNGVDPFAQQAQQASEQAAGQGDGNDDAQPDNGQDATQQRQGLMGAGQ